MAEIMGAGRDDKKVHSYHIFTYAAVFSHLLFSQAIVKVSVW